MKRKKMSGLFTRLTAGLLVLTIFFTSCEWPLQVHATETAGQSEAFREAEEEFPSILAEDYEEVEDEELQMVGELDELRTESTKQFRMEDGSVSLVEYDMDVHYQEESGEWEQIDNSLTEEEAADDSDAAGFTNQKNRVKVKFAKNPNANFLVRIMQGKYHVFFTAVDRQKQAEGAKVLDKMQEMGIVSVPMLAVDDRLLTFEDAIKFINER